MNKRRLHHFWTRLRLIKPWYFLVIALVSGVISISALRANNQHMVRLRDAVYAADRDNTDVQTALNNLQAYVTAHMNTNLSTGNSVYPPIQLTHTYDRLLQQAQAAAAAKQTSSPLYTEAQAYCEQQDPVDFSGHNRVPCIEQYVGSHGGIQAPTTTTVTIPDVLYQFSFATPAWSPDLAGWSLLVASLSGLLFIVTMALHQWFRRNVA